MGITATNCKLCRQLCHWYIDSLESRWGLEVPNPSASLEGECYNITQPACRIRGSCALRKEVECLYHVDTLLCCCPLSRPSDERFSHRARSAPLPMATLDNMLRAGVPVPRMSMSGAEGHMPEALMDPSAVCLIKFFRTARLVDFPPIAS